mgnify:FL=1
MRKSRMNRNKNKKPIIIGSIISVVLFALIAVVYIYKDELFSSKITTESEEVTPDIVETQEELNEAVVEDNKQLDTEQQDEQPDKMIEVDAAGYAIAAAAVAEPTYIDGILIANKKYPLPQDFNPGENKEARAALDQMAADAKALGFDLVAFSGFRSYEYQTTLYNNYVNRDGKEAADRYSARPGHSEHQTGLAFDVGEKSREDLWLTAEFGETPAGKWLADNAYKYGFILRYPEGKEDVTGFMYEAWHFRYLGVEKATEVKQTGLTLEEYLSVE